MFRWPTATLTAPVLRTLLSGAALLTATVAFAQTATPLVSFPSGNTIGETPLASVIQAADGFFYGTTDSDTGCGCGTVFSYSPQTGPALEYQFTAKNTSPYALTQAPSGALWGVTDSGGANGYGMVYLLTGALTIDTVYSFTNGKDGSYPGGALAVGSDGNLWGVTINGGNGAGTVFEVSPHTGAFTTVYAMTASTDGQHPYGPLVQGTDGAFYGALAEAPGSIDGGVFRITTAGAYSIYAIFPMQSGSQLFPEGDVAFLPDGTLLGATAGGDTAADPEAEGTVYALTTGGTKTIVHAFDDGEDGAFPFGGLYAASDGSFYGTTEGDSTDGSLYSISPSLDFATISQFGSDALGSTPQAHPIQGSDGNFYGTSAFDGTNNGGVFYQFAPAIALPPPVSVTLSTPVAKPSGAYTITGTVRNAAAVSSQICYAYANGSELGKLTGTLSGITWTGTLPVTASATAGEYSIAVTCAGQISGFATLDVTADGKAATTLALAAGPNPVYGGANITFTAAAARSGATGVPTGTVSFYLGSTAFASAPLVNGVATLTAPSSKVPYGTYNIYAVYSGDSTDDGSTSNTLSVTSEAKLASKTTLTATESTVAANGSDTFTATVTAANGTPAGTVTFTSSGYTIGTETLDSSGVAKLPASAAGVPAGVPAGTYAVYATYNGDSSRNASTSNAFYVTVQ